MRTIIKLMASVVLMNFNAISVIKIEEIKQKAWEILDSNNEFSELEKKRT